MKLSPIRVNTSLLLCVLLIGVSACASTREPAADTSRPFEFGRDTFAYANELGWEYQHDPVTGGVSTQKREPKPDFVQRCFAVARMARQFFQYARFEPASPPLDDGSYRKVVQAVITRTPDQARRRGKVVVPGYPNLNSFSRERESMLKASSGSAWQSYLHFSNWRMVFPFSRSHQQDTAQQLMAKLGGNRLPIVHLIQFAPFPVTAIDHVVVIISATETPLETRFSLYDPNNTTEPGLLTYDHASRSFIFPTTNYFIRGKVDVYEIFSDELA